MNTMLSPIQPVLPPFPFVEEWGAVIAANGFYKGRQWGALPTYSINTNNNSNHNNNNSNSNNNSNNNDSNTSFQPFSVQSNTFVGSHENTPALTIKSNGNNYSNNNKNNNSSNNSDAYPSTTPSQNILEINQENVPVYNHADQKSSSPAHNVDTQTSSSRKNSNKKSSKQRQLQGWEKQRLLRKQQRRHREEHQELQAIDEANWRQQQIQWKQRQKREVRQREEGGQQQQRNSVDAGDSKEWQGVDLLDREEEAGNGDEYPLEQQTDLEDGDESGFVKIDPEFAERFARAEARIEARHAQRIAKATRSRRQRQDNGFGRFGRRSKGWHSKGENSEDIAKHQARLSARRSEEAKGRLGRAKLFGSEPHVLHEILTLEARLALTFDAQFARTKPVLWPEMPIAP